MKNKIIQSVGSWLPDALYLAGACATSVGAGLVYAPAGWIVGGVHAMVASVLLARSGSNG